MCVHGDCRCNLFRVAMEADDREFHPDATYLEAKLYVDKHRAEIIEVEMIQAKRDEAMPFIELDPVALRPRGNDMTTCTRILEFDAAHRVMRHESKCASLHGHRYKVELTCEAEELDDVGRVIDFGVLKSIVGKWIDDRLDHTTLVNVHDETLLDWCMRETKDHGKRLPYVMPGEPTAENIARLLLIQSRNLLRDINGLQVTRVRVWETPNCFATATGSDTLIPVAQL